MKNFMLHLSAIACLTLSLFSFAAELTPKDISRIDHDVTAMATFLQLTEQQSTDIKHIRQELLLKNKQALSEHGKGTPALKKARQTNTKAYNKQLYKIVPQKEVKKWQKSKSKKNA